MKEAELVGWVAVAVVLANQVLMTSGFIDLQKNMKLFLGLNLLGAVLLLITALLLNFLPLIVLEGVIIAMSTFRFFQTLFK